MSKRNYINPSVIRATAQLLKEYKHAHPKSATPMIDAIKEFATRPETTEYDRARFLSAARMLGWNVCKTRGHVYENGLFAW